MYILRDNREDGLKLSVVVWVKSKSQKSWLKQENSRLLTDETKNLSSPRNSDLLTKKCKYLISKLQCFNKLFSPNEAHQWLRHESFIFFASDWVTKTIYIVAPLRLAVFAATTIDKWTNMQWVIIAYLYMASIVHALWLAAERALWKFSRLDSSLEFWVIAVSENNGKDGQSSTIFSITERKTILLLQYERRREP